MQLISSALPKQQFCVIQSGSLPVAATYSGKFWAVGVLFPDQSRGTENSICNLSHSTHPVTAVPFARRPSHYLPSWFTKLPFLSWGIMYQSHSKTPWKKTGGKSKHLTKLHPLTIMTNWKFSDKELLSSAENRKTHFIGFTMNWIFRKTFMSI